MITFNLECTQCDVSTSFDCGDKMMISTLEALTQAAHREASPECLGELLLCSHFIQAIPAKDA